VGKKGNSPIKREIQGRKKRATPRRGSNSLYSGPDGTWLGGKCGVQEIKREKKTTEGGRKKRKRDWMLAGTTATKCPHNRKK